MMRPSRQRGAGREMRCCGISLGSLSLLNNGCCKKARSTTLQQDGFGWAARGATTIGARKA
jgi:hypothetical protein